MYIMAPGFCIWRKQFFFKMTGGAIQSNDGMVGAGVYVYGSLNGKASFEMTGGKLMITVSQT